MKAQLFHSLHNPFAQRSKQFLPALLQKNTRDQIFFILVVLAASSYQLYGSMRFFAALALVSVLVLYGQYFSSRHKLKIPDILMIGLGISVFFLSILDLLPTAWSGIRDPLTILKHTFPFLAAPLVILAFIYLIERIESDLVNISWIGLATTSTLAIFVYMNTDQIFGEHSFFAINNLYTLEMFRFFFFGYLLYHYKSVVFRTLLLCVFFALSHSFQAKIACILAFTMLFIQLRLYHIILALILSFVLMLVATHYTEAMFQIDQNMGVRSVFWRDALQLLYETDGLGVGFGTESITNIYHERGFSWHFRPSFAEAWDINVHNSFLQVFFRGGFIGGLLFMIWLLSKIRLGFRFRHRLSQLDSFMTALLVLTLCVNVAFFSLNFFFGTCWVIAWLARYRKPFPIRRPILVKKLKYKET